MDIALLRTRFRPATDGKYGTECWLIGVRPPGESTPILSITNHPGDIIHAPTGDDVTQGDGVATSEDATFTSPTGAWVVGDVGKNIFITGAGVAGAILATTIASRNSSTSIELTVAPSTSVNPATFTYGTDSILYTAYNCSAEPPDTDANFALPEATLRISNVLRSLITSLHANDFYRNYQVEIIPYNTEQPGVDYSADTKELVWVNHKMDGQDLLVTLGIPEELTRIVPSDQYSTGNCRHRFRLSTGVYAKRCGYAVKDIVAIIIPGSPYGRLSVEVTAHGFTTGDLVELSAVTGITPSLNDVFVVEYFNANVFKLDGTDGADYTGSYTSGGKAGFYCCEGYRAACIARNRLANFGAVIGQRSDALRVGV